MQSNTAIENCKNQNLHKYYTTPYQQGRSIPDIVNFVQIDCRHKLSCLCYCTILFLLQKVCYECNAL